MAINNFAENDRTEILKLYEMARTFLIYQNSF